jgi:hypothetical protein
MRVPWQKGIWRPLIRQRQALKEQELSPPGDWYRAQQKKRRLMRRPRRIRDTGDE